MFARSSAYGFTARGLSSACAQTRPGLSDSVAAHNSPLATLFAADQEIRRSILFASDYDPRPKEFADQLGIRFGFQLPDMRLTEFTHSLPFGAATGCRFAATQGVNARDFVVSAIAKATP
jgi:hypothetical protein